MISSSRARTEKLFKLFKLFRGWKILRNRKDKGVSIGRKGAIYWEKRCDLLGEKVRLNMWIT